LDEWISKNFRLKYRARVERLGYGEKRTRPGRFELPTYGFEVQRSIQLSYGRAGFNYQILIDLELGVNAFGNIAILNLDVFLTS
jgi:hypothetical protein